MNKTEDIKYDLLDYHSFQYNKIDTKWDELTSGGGTSTWNSGGYIILNVSSQNDRVVRQTKEYYLLKGGKYKRTLFTSVLNLTNATGYTSRIGNFDDHTDKVVDSGGAGLFFEYTDNILYVGIRYGTTDNGTNTLIAQDNFNVNPLNRDSNLSKIEWTKICTYEIIYNDLGFVEWSIYLDGERFILHRLQDITNVLNVLPTFSLPLRMEITKNTNDGGATVGEMRQFSNSIFYQSGDNMDNYYNKKIRYLSPIIDTNFNITNTAYRPLFSVRLKDNFVRVPIINYELFYLTNSGGQLVVGIAKNPTFTGSSPSWTNPNNDYYIEYDTNAGNVNVNTLDIIYEEFIDGDERTTNRFNFSRLLDNVYLQSITSDIGGTSDIITIMAKKKSNKNVSSFFNFRWIEYV